MKKIIHQFKSLTRVRQFALVGAFLALIAVFMPWHATGVATLGTENIYKGLNDQNFIIGFLTLVFSTGTLLLVGLPLLRVQPPRFRWSESSILLFFGGETALLTLVLMIMPSTSLSRAVTYDLRYGIYLAFIGAVLVFLSGYWLRLEEESKGGIGRHEPLTRLPHRRDAEGAPAAHHSTASTEKSIDTVADDSRMRLDL